MLDRHPEIDNIGEVSPVIWDIHQGVKLAALNMRYPTPLAEDVTRVALPGHAVRQFFIENFHSEMKAWVIKPIGLIGKVRQAFADRHSDEQFVEWFMAALRDCFPNASVYTLVRDPLEYANSARRYWGATIDNVRHDLEFMSALLQFGGLTEDQVIPFADFRKNQASYIGRIISEAGLPPIELAEEVLGKRYAAEQGKAVQDGSAVADAIADLTASEKAYLLTACGEEYDRFLSDPRDMADAPVDSPMEDETDYRDRYMALTGEFQFLKVRAEGLETLVNEKEDIVQKLLRWTKILDRKAETFAKALREANVPLPPIVGDDS
jgi:hypothetical protein